MRVGFNHNITYKGEQLHVQTEDSGVKNPHIITLLYRGGNILASKKTSYADIVKMDNLEQVVEELMKEQHKEMLRRLKGGEFDERLGVTGVAADTSLPPSSPQPAPPQPPAPADPGPLLEVPSTAPPKEKQTLDDIIFDFLTASDDKK